MGACAALQICHKWKCLSNISRNVIAKDRQAAADSELENLPQLLQLMRGLEIVQLCWDSEPEISEFDPHIDR